MKTVRVLHGKDVHHIELSATTTVREIKQELARCTHVPTVEQKLMLKKRMLKVDHEVLYQKLHLKDKLILIGVPQPDLIIEELVSSELDSAPAEALAPEQPPAAAMALEPSHAKAGAMEISPTLEGIAESASTGRTECEMSRQERLEHEFKVVLRLSYNEEASLLLQGLLCSTEGAFTRGVYENTVGQCSQWGVVELAPGVCQIETDIGGAQVWTHEPLVILAGTRHQLSVTSPNGVIHQIDAVYMPEECGVHIVEDPEGNIVELNVQSSALSCVCKHWDGLFDQVFWGWRGDWTPELHDAVCGIVIEAENGLGLLDALPDGKREATKLRQLIVDSASTALDLHSPQSVSVSRAAHCRQIGQLHLALYQFLEFTSIMPLVPSGLIQAVDQYDQAKVKASSHQALASQLAQLQQSGLVLSTHSPTGL